MRLYICDTPYQLLNVLSLAIEDSTIKADLYIVNQFTNADEICKRVKATAIFKNVFLIKKDVNRASHKGIYRTLKMMVDFLNPNGFLIKLLPDAAYVNRSIYSEIFASCMTTLTSAMIKANKNAEVSFYEDGTGSYDGNIIFYQDNALKTLFFKAFKCGSYSAKVQKLYVNNVEICRAVGFEEILAIPKKSDTYFKIVNNIFSIQQDYSLNKRIVWLSQPNDGLPGTMDVRNISKQILMKWKEEILVRLHPRDADNDFYKEFCVDNGEKNWELSIQKADINNLCLIGYCSGAQFTPKLWYGLEPTLIFTYMLNDSLPQNDITHFDNLVKLIKDKYTNKNKIVVVENKEQLIHVLENMLCINELC